MKIEDKKLSMADRMYKQNSSGGVGKNPKNYMIGKETKKNHRGEKFEMHGKGKGKEAEKSPMSNRKGSFKVDNHQADPHGSIKGGYKM